MAPVSDINPIIGGGGRFGPPSQTFYCHFSRKCRRSLKLGDFSQNDVEITLRIFFLRLVVAFGLQRPFVEANFFSK